MYIEVKLLHSDGIDNVIEKTDFCFARNLNRNINFFRNLNSIETRKKRSIKRERTSSKLCCGSLENALLEKFRNHVVHAVNDSS